MAKVLVQPVVTALVMGGPTALTPCKTSRPPQKEPFTSAQGKLSVRTPQISLYFTVVRPSDGKRPHCPSQSLLNITHGGSEGTNRPSGDEGLLENCYESYPLIFSYVSNLLKCCHYSIRVLV